MGGFTWYASGNKVSEETRNLLRDAFEAIEAIPGVADANVLFHRGDQGWSVNGSGSSDDPGTHNLVFEAIKAAANTPGANTGSTAFTSAHLSTQNFHTPVAADAAPDGVG